MAQKILKTRIKQRIDTAENWAQTTEAPLEGEIIIYKSTVDTIPDKIKIGDGVTTASNLPFITDIDTNNLSAGVRIPESDTNSLGSATQGIYWSNGRPQLMTYTLGKSVPSNAVFTDTNTKVTSAANHYAPQTDSASAINVDASSTTAATWGTTSLVTGVNLTRDTKGHVTGMTVDSIKMPANPDTGATSVEVTGSGNAITSASYSSSTRKLTLTKGATYNNYTLPNAGTALGGVKSGGVATIADGIITAVSNASNADKVANSLAIQGNGTGITFDGSAAKTVNIKGAGTVSVSGNTSGVITITGSAHPTALKNPNALTIDVNGTSTSYDGSSAKSVTINAASLGLSSAMQFGGVVTSLPTSSTAGTVVLMGNKEYVYDANGNWVELGDEGSHALKTITITAGAGLTGGGTLESNRTIAHSNSITAGSVGAAASPSHGGTFAIPKITYDAQGHITSATTVNITLPADSNTHWTANLITGTSATATSNGAATSPYLNLVENGSVRNSHQITGAGTVSVASDANGKITITGSAHPTVNNATVTITAGSGLTGSGSFTLNQSSAKSITLAHSNVITAGTAKGGSGTLAAGDTFTVPSISYDTNGHITEATTTTYTLPVGVNAINITQTTGDILILDCN